MSSSLASPPVTIVTGAGGWLGQAIADQLSDVPEAVRLATLSAAEGTAVRSLAPEASIFTGDLLDPMRVDELLEGAEGADLIHTASVIHPGEIGDFDRINVGLTRLLAEKAAAAKVRRFIYVSSNSPFGFNPTRREYFRTNDAYSPYLGYGRSKMEAEMIIKRLADSGTEFVIIRPPWFYGPFQPDRQTDFLSKVRKGLFPVVGDGNNMRSMVSVESLAAGIRQAQLAPRAANRSYWLTDAKPYTFKEIVRTVKQALELEGLKVSTRIPKLPHLACSIARLGDKQLQSRGRYSQSIHVLGELDMNIACSPVSAVADFGFEPATDLCDGMRRSIVWALSTGAEL